MGIPDGWVGNDISPSWSNHVSSLANYLSRKCQVLDNKTMRLSDEKVPIPPSSSPVCASVPCPQVKWNRKTGNQNNRGKSVVSDYSTTFLQNACRQGILRRDVSAKHRVAKTESVLHSMQRGRGGMVNGDIDAFSGLR